MFSKIQKLLSQPSAVPNEPHDLYANKGVVSFTKSGVTKRYRGACGLVHNNKLYVDGDEVIEGDNRFIPPTADEKKHTERRLLSAAEKGNLPLVKALIEAKTDINASDEVKRTPASYATMNNQMDTLKWLVNEAKADVHHLSPSLLSLAIANGHDRVVEWLIKEIKVNVNEKDRGRYALHQALTCERSHHMIRCLVEAKADLIVKDEFDRSACEVARDACAYNTSEYRADLAKQNYRYIKQQSIYAPWPDKAFTLGRMLQRALNDKDLAKELLLAKADVNFRGNKTVEAVSQGAHTRTPLELAICDHNLEMVELLVEAKADLTLQSTFYEQLTPMQLASDYVTNAYKGLTGSLEQSVNVYEYLQKHQEEEAKRVSSCSLTR